MYEINAQIVTKCGITLHYAKNSVWVSDWKWHHRGNTVSSST